MGLSDLPLASGQKHRKAFESLGWIVRRDSNHIVMTHPAHPDVNLSIPNHDEVKKQTLKRIVATAGLTDKLYRAVFDSL